MTPQFFSLYWKKTEKKQKFFWTVFVVFISRQLDFVIVVVLILDERRELEIRKTGLNRHRIDELNREFIISLLDGPSGNVKFYYCYALTLSDMGGN